jgi:hypothetical protein
VNRRILSTWDAVVIGIVALAALALVVGPGADNTRSCSTQVGLSIGGGPATPGPCVTSYDPPPPAVDGPTARRALLAAYNTLLSAEQRAGPVDVDRSIAEENFGNAVARITFPDRALADVAALRRATDDTDENALFISLPAITAAVAAITRGLIMYRP